MIEKFTDNVKKYFSKKRGWTTHRKLIVFEVDDYGLDYCEPSKKENNAWTSLSFFYEHDRLENKADLENLIEVLLAHKDKNNRHPVFTPYVVVANPVLDKTALTNGNYKLRPFYESIKLSYGSEVVALWKKTVTSGLFSPEFHAREHFNLNFWLSELDNKTSVASKALAQGRLDNGKRLKSHNRNLKAGAAFDFVDFEDFRKKEIILKDGLDRFEELFERKSICFTPPAGGYSYLYEPLLIENGIKAVSLGTRHLITDKDGNSNKHFHYIGQKSESGVIYTPRNALFEPHSGIESDWVGRCMKNIDFSFKSKKPAIISSHRINFVNNENPANGQGTSKLNKLLTEILKKWPEAEFVSSKELTEIILKSKNVS